jgi:hypothetical protein
MDIHNKSSQERNMDGDIREIAQRACFPAAKFLTATPFSFIVDVESFDSTIPTEDIKRDF